MKKLLIFGLAFGISIGMEAQNIYDNYVSASWNYNVPLSSNDFLTQGSGAGFQIGFRKKIDRFYIGADFTYATYSSQKSRTTFYADNSATTTDTHNFAYSYGFTVNGEYIFRPFKKLMPFIGLGIGANSINYWMYYNIYTSKDNGLGGLFRPQAGILMKLGKESKIAVMGVVHYDYSTAASTVFGYSSFPAYGFRLGIALNIPNGIQ
ncbi:MAG TPA: hypothetical protein PLR06_03705 [Cyclobacteriaceae bacterium]|nr:hypothetical protein [Cyclobacteriaceae bacterium]